MKKKMNPSELEVEDQVIEVDESNPMDLPPWYVQLSKLDVRKRKRIADTALERVRETKPTAYQFIKNFNCQLVGIAPRVEYALVNPSEGDTDVTYVHPFSMPTLVYWCKKGEFAFFVNANLDYNNTVLNKVSGNRRESIKGFTG